MECLSPRWFVCYFTKVFVLGLVMSQLGCASLVGGPAASVGPQPDFGRVSLQVAPSPLQVEVVGVPRSKAEAAGSTGGGFLARCAGEGLRTGVGYIFWLPGCVLAMPIAAAVGASKALSADDVEASTSVVTDATALRQAAEELRRAVETAADRVAPGRLQPSGVAADNELRLAISKIVFSGDGEPDGPIVFRFTVDASVVRRSDDAVIRSNSFSFMSEALRLREWSADAGRRIDTASKRAITALADSIVDAVFLLYPFPYEGQPSAVTWFTGLQAEYPGRSGSFFDPYWASVDSLSPKFRWQAFPRDVDITADPAAMKRVGNVSYELVIAEEENGAAGAMIYHRIALPSNEHKLEVSLQPNKRYFWTVRARFMLDGHQYVTEWAERAPPTLVTPTRAKQRFTAPSAESYRFKTP